MHTQQNWWCGKASLWGVWGAAAFSIYPNPAKDYVELRWDWFEMGIASDLRVEIFSISGQLALKQAISNYQNNIAVIPTDGLQTGMYLVNIVTANNEVIYTEKLTINK